MKSCATAETKKPVDMSAGTPVATRREAMLTTQPLQTTRRRAGRRGAHRELKGLLRHDDVLAASVARSAVAREDLLASGGISGEGRGGGRSEDASSNDRGDLGGDLGDRGGEGLGRADKSSNVKEGVPAGRAMQALSKVRQGVPAQARSAEGFRGQAWSADILRLVNVVL